MKSVNNKYLLYLLISVSAGAWFIDAAFRNINLNDLVSFLKLVPDVVTFDCVMIYVFHRWLWKWRLFQGWLIHFPDLNGTWIGEIQSNWKDANGNSVPPIPTMLTIKQSFARLSCRMKTGEMISTSYGEGFRIVDADQLRQFHYCYTSRPSITLRDRSTPHDGAILFNIIGDPPERLEGEYWTQRQTCGIITLHRHSNALMDEFPVNFPSHPLKSTNIINTPKQSR